MTKPSRKHEWAGAHSDPCYEPRDPQPAMARRRRGARAHLFGLSAEGQVARHYERAGATVAARRWRGTAGEIDLVLRDGDGLIFVEVKSAATHAAAIARISDRQRSRLCLAATEYLGSEPRGLLTEARFDIALVDARGQIEVLENGFA